LPPVRSRDEFESLGGVRYRRLVPRWALGSVLALVGFILIMLTVGSGGGGFFAAEPTPNGGLCPIGYVTGMMVGPSGEPVPDGTCQRLP
jgi:hypothetical protein